MMSRHATRSTRLASRQAGFTLIELMIAMILGMVVIAGITSVFLAGQQSFRANSALSDVQDSSRIAFELMARDLRQTGFTGCGGDRIGNALNNGPVGTSNAAPTVTSWWAYWGTTNNHGGLQGYGSGDTDPAVTSGSAAGNRVSTTDSLAVLSSTTLPVRITADDGTTLTLDKAAANLASGDVIVVCDPDHAVITQATGVAGTSITHAASGTPGNCSAALNYPVACPGSVSYVYQNNATIGTLNAVDWYVGHNGVGGTSLYRISLENVGGTPTPTAQEMVRDVTGMAITYLQGGTSFVAASAVTDWSQVTAVHVELTVESSFKRAGTDTKPISRTFAFTTTLRNRVQ